jgi:hypothetical protein
MQQLHTGQNKSDDCASSAQPETNNRPTTQCPTCGVVITGFNTRGRGRHEAQPCGHQVSDAYLDTPRVATDGGREENR